MKKMLLHSCCGPCSTHVIETLINEYDLTIFYYNPSIFPSAEYQKRLQEQKRYAKIKGINVIEGKYDEDEFLSRVRGHEGDAEGGGRCAICFEMRLTETALRAKEGSFDIFATTLTVSPHKNAELINAIGKRVGEEYDIEFLPSNFKKADGYKKSVELSKRFGLYRQNYCGCRFSVRKDSV